MGTESPRVSKREFISRVAARSGQPAEVVEQVYGVLIGELTSAVGAGETVVLAGFGRFYRQTHKGHKVRFGKKDVGDYLVLKFSASRVVNRGLENGVGLDEARSDNYGTLVDSFDVGLEPELEVRS
ncbi:HU family DNA-binding protein [Streptomyces sp. NPDC056061]|uniref:HU family DNA-binding protein n=1 Tax=Streptomyces sp. NPDC056061 TaxID=3345700 RepID=UPI0035D58E16